jgi:hypothetical protein
MKTLGIFAGEKALTLVREKLNSVGNIMKMQSQAYDDLEWGIEAQVENGKV